MGDKISRTSSARYFMQIVHEYTPKVSLTEWGATEIRFNNRVQIGEPTPAAIELYKSWHRLDSAHIEWNDRFECIYGYKWQDIRYELVTEVTEITKQEV